MIDREQIEQTILDLVRKRGPGKSICPSEAARQLAPDDWRPLMEDVRNVAAKLAQAGKLVILQKGEVVSLQASKGPIRLALPNKN